MLMIERESATGDLAAVARDTLAAATERIFAACIEVHAL